MKREAKVLGITYGATGNSYQLILTDMKTNKNIPIIIGAFEAQAISIELEGIKSPRPLTHDLIISLISSMGRVLDEIYVYKFEEGVFFSKLIFDSGDLVIESRTSDAIAIALKSKCPIYVNSSVVSTTSVGDDNSTEDKDLEIEDLKISLEEAIANEDYEKASEIKSKLKNK